MPLPVFALLLPLGGAAAAAAAQGFDARPRIERAHVAAGNYIDLDSGFVLGAPKLRHIVADLRFDRDGAGFVVVAPHGAVTATERDERPRGDAEWTRGPLRIHVGAHVSRGRWFVKTNRMTVARVDVVIVQTRGTPSALISWVRAPESKPVFVSAPRGLEAHWQGAQAGAIDLRWRGAGKFLVEDIPVGGEPRLQVVTQPKFRLQTTGQAAFHRILVRRILGDGTIGLPVALTLRTRRALAHRFIITLPGNWYRTNGGLDLARGEARVDAPDVVLYPYGVYSPHGGILRVGNGRRAYRQLIEIPDHGYLPVYDRLDDGDVFAARLADGRFAKFMIEAVGTHVLDGLQVHGAFLASGLRRFLPAPGRVTFACKGGEFLVLHWEAVPDAQRYEVRMAGAAKPAATTQRRRAVIGPLAVNRFYRLEVITIDATGDRSDPRIVDAHTFGAGFRVGSFTLNTSGSSGFSLSHDAVAAANAGDVELVITNSAGGASSLTFRAPYGVAPCTGLPFGSFPDGKTEAAFGKTLESDDRVRGSDVFWVRTRTGGIAGVKIRTRAYPLIEFDCVVREPRH